MLRLMGRGWLLRFPSVLLIPARSPLATWPPYFLWAVKPYNQYGRRGIKSHCHQIPTISCLILPNQTNRCWMIVPPHTKYSFSPLFSNFSFGPEQVYKDNDKEQGQQLTGRSTDTIAKQMVLLQPTGKHHHYPHWRESEPTLITLRCRPVNRNQ